MDGKEITRLVVQKKNPKRVNVYLDNEFAFGLTRSAAGWLSVGQVLDETQVQELLKTDHDETIYNKALNYLGVRVRSEHEVRKKLVDIGYEESDIDKALDRLKQNHLIDDQDFSEQWIENRNTFRPRSRRMLVYELRQKGISEEMIQASLQDVDDYQTAFELASRRSRKLQGLEWNDFRKKLGSYLAGKGYGYDVIQTVVRQVWEQDNAAETGVIDETEEMNYDE